ncbi:phage late control D family protein [Ancylobacter aquaticus]|nr:phage late control D family protein [Ancylobacter aquaticus]
MKPDFRIIADGADVTAKIRDRLQRLEITDVDGVESDTLEIEIDDRDNAVVLPEKGARLRVWIGYRETGLDQMGEYTVDEVSVETSPAIIIVHAKSADLKDSFKAQKTRHWENTTIGDIVAKIAGEHDLPPAVDPQLAARRIAYLPQTEESDLHFLTRLGRRHDALLAPKNGRLVGVRRGDGRAGSGAALDGVVLGPGDITLARATMGDRPRHGAIEAEWYDLRKAERRTIIIQQGAGEGAHMRLPHPYQDEDEAQRAAEARGRELERASGSLSVEMPGRTDIAAEMPVIMKGFRDPIAGRWTIEQASHVIDQSGYVTSFECGKGDDSDEEAGSGSGGGDGSFYE